VAVKSVIDEDELMLITRNGVVNRQRVAEIRTIGRATQGVRLVNLDDGDRVVDLARVIGENGDDEDLDDIGLPREAEGAVGHPVEEAVRTAEDQTSPDSEEA
jgi:DNA gyrase subunit A